MICIHCQSEITEKFFETEGEHFHWQCVRDILREYVIDSRKRDEHTNRLEAMDLVKKLGYCSHSWFVAGALAPREGYKVFATVCLDVEHFACDLLHIRKAGD